MTVNDECDDAGDPALEATEVATPAGGEAGARGGARLERGAMVGRYRIESFVGGGGMGWVYRARDTELERDVAIKVLRPGTGGAKGRERLLAEARAMAKLQHRAVVPVYDVGEHGDGVYVAMALLTGGTLHDWMHARPRPWREVVTRFIEAGRGLEAAHAAGLVHRDFKPRNVLLGGNGEVQVADFGIASASVTDAGLDSGGDREASTIAGTPAYMAPEQASGKAVDARADQYSFCVSLWEGLHGQRPQEAETRTQAGVVPSLSDAPRTRRRVPGWLTAAVARGFSPAPERRWPTMQSLLDALERGQGRRRRFVLGSIAFLAAAGVVATYVITRAAPRDPCVDSARAASRAWGPVSRMVVAAAMRQASARLADETLARVEPQLDRYAEELTTTIAASCRADRAGSVDLRVAASRRVCFDGMVKSMREAVAALSRPSRDAIVSSVPTVASLPALRNCTDTGRVAKMATMSAGAKAQVEAVSASIDEASKLYVRGEYDQYLAAARSIVVAARATGYAPAIARSLQVLNQAMGNMGLDTTEVDRELVRVAAEGHDDEMLVIAWTVVISDIVNNGGDPATAEALLPVVDAALGRVAASPNAPNLRFRASLAKGIVAATKGRFPDAVAAFEDAGQRTDSPIDRYDAKTNVVLVYMAAGDERRAIEAAKEAVDLAAQAWGPNHPQVALARVRLAQRRVRAGDVSGANADLDAARAMLIDTFGETAVWLYEVYDASATLAAERGDHALELRERQRLVELDRQTRAQGPFPCAHTVDLAQALARSGQQPEADATFRDGLQCYRAAGGLDTVGYASAEVRFADSLVVSGQCVAARPLLAHGMTLLGGRMELAIALVATARCDYEGGRRDLAYAGAEKALTICADESCPPSVALRIKADYGGWLYSAGTGTRARGTTLLREAVDGYMALGDEASAEATRGRITRSPSPSRSPR